MKRVINTPSIVLAGQELEINASPKYGCYVEILERMKQQIDAMLSYHSRVIMVRVDLHIEDYQPDNTVVSSFLRTLRKRLLSKYGLKRLGFVWVREKERAKSQHYHLALFIDACKVQRPHNIISKVETLWQSRSHPKPFTPKNCYYIIKRDEPETLIKPFQRLSYFAKVRGKGYKNKTANDFSTSRIKPK